MCARACVVCGDRPTVRRTLQRSGSNSLWRNATNRFSSALATRRICRKQTRFLSHAAATRRGRRVERRAGDRLRAGQAPGCRCCRQCFAGREAPPWPGRPRAMAGRPVTRSHGRRHRSCAAAFAGAPWRTPPCASGCRSQAYEIPPSLHCHRPAGAGFCLVLDPLPARRIFAWKVQVTRLRRRHDGVFCGSNPAEAPPPRRWQRHPRRQTPQRLGHRRWGR